MKKIKRRIRVKENEYVEVEDTKKKYNKKKEKNSK